MDAMVTARVPVEIKKRSCMVLERLGVTPSQAINALLSYVATANKLPDLRSETQIAYEKRPRILDIENLTPDMKLIAKAMRSIQSLGSVDWGCDADIPYKELIEEGRRADYEALL